MCTTYKLYLNCSCSELLSHILIILGIEEGLEKEKGGPGEWHHPKGFMCLQYLLFWQYSFLNI